MRKDDRSGIRLKRGFDDFARMEARLPERASGKLFDSDDSALRVKLDADKTS